MSFVLLTKPQGNATPARKNPAPAKPGRDKAELEFHSALHFNRTLHGFNPTSEPKAHESFVIWWQVWNTGWKPAPEHYNRLTIYKADLCSGCRRESDQVYMGEFLAPAIVSGEQQGESEYDMGQIISGLDVGLYDAYVELDVKNEVDELNEDNNMNFMSFAVRPSTDTEAE